MPVLHIFTCYPWSYGAACERVIDLLDASVPSDAYRALITDSLEFVGTEGHERPGFCQSA